MEISNNSRRLELLRGFIKRLGVALDTDISVKLWDGSIVPLGRQITRGLRVEINHPGVIPSLLRRPTLDRLIRLYIDGQIDFSGGTLIDFGRQVTGKEKRRRLKKIGRLEIVKTLAPFLLAPGIRPNKGHRFDGDESGNRRRGSDNKDYVQFHYDVGNDFYQLFLDQKMVYSCACFKDDEMTLDQAQTAKLDIICRKLRLRQGEHFLDIGCGWGALICYAAAHYGVRAHGVTLSREQLDLARATIKQRDLEDRVTVELRDYSALTGSYDKIASIGMYEHIGVANYPTYFSTIRTLLAPGGLFLNHGITRRAKKHKTVFGLRPEQRALQKYIFPGGELDDIGHTLQQMEMAKFEVLDVEAWRMHYAKTTQIWCERLTAARREAVALSCEQTYRIWAAYLGGVSLAFARGSVNIYQVLLSAKAGGAPPIPPTRSDLYED